MDTLKESLAPKTFNKISHLAVLVWFVIGAIFLGIFTEVENTESRFDFRCGGAETENTDLVRGDCFQQYEEQYNKYGVPIYGFVTINFFLIALVCAIFSQIVRKTVDELSPSTRNGDRESQSRHREKQKSTGKQLFIAYCCQLSTRLVLGVLFMILQTQLLYPLRFPYKFDCYLTSGTNQPRNLSDAAQNSTQFHKCNNQRAEKKTFWMYAVLAVNGIYVAGILIETIYILSRARVETKFMKNSEFLKIHLNPNHDKSYQEPQKQEGRIQVVVMQPRVHDNLPTQPGLHPEPQRQDDVAQSQPREREHRPIQVEIHVHPQKQDDVIPPHPREQEHRPTKMESYQEPQRQNDVVPLPPRDQIGSHQEPQQPEGRSEHDIISPVQREPEQLQNSNLQLFIAETKKIIKENTQHLFELQPPFLGNPGEQTAVKYFTLDQIYTNLVVVPNRATYDFTANREEQLKVYPRPRTESQLKSLEDLLNDKSKKVLIVGRPGIGKTFCCTKLLRNWACKEVSEIHFDPAFLIKFRRFNSDNHLSLRELLVQSEHFPSDHLDDEVWKYILQHPESVLILFDGFDEFNHNANIIQWPASSPKSIEQKVPLQSLYYWLVTGKLLKNALILTTTRPTALSSIKRLPFDKTCEILGFTTEQIKEYVSRFCGDDKQAGERLWRHISSNMNLLSLCYIPVNSFIMCSSLFEILQFESSASATLPSELTTLYMIAVTVFYLKHTKEFRDNESTREHLDYNNLPPEVEEKFEKLGKVAFEGIKKGKLILGGNEVHGIEDSALFHRLPDCRSDALKREPQFCFIHLTMQEFFAARHLANNVSETELRNFVTKNSENGKWQLVIQFLAGLMNDKDELPSEIITDLLPVETEEEERYDDDEQTGNEEEWKVTCWPTKDKRDLAVTLCKCVNESKKMEIIVQRKLQQINFNCVNFIASHLTAVECSSLINVIKNIEQISHLDLMDNNMDSLGCLEIAKLLIYWKCRLSWLNLAENQLTDEAVKHLANAITNNNCQLRSLNLSENNITDTGAQHLAEAITNNNCQLRSLNLSENNITDTGAQHLAEAITNNKCQLHTLSLSFNYITVTGAQHLAEAITDSCQLRSLNLSKNNITNTGAQYLADAITKNNFQLRTLNLSQNNITDTGVQHLAHAITSNNCQLHTLNLSYNNITDTGAQHLADAITNNDCQLHTLDLLGNNITDTGAQHLADAITNNNCQLRSLNLSYNNMTEVGKQHARNLVSKSQSKCKLDI